MAKYKMTLFARFIIFLIIVIPVAYIIANYINGQDGIDQFLSFFRGNEDTTELVEQPSPPPTKEVSVGEKEMLQAKKDSIDLLRKQLDECRNQ
jgi:hypothetical protein